MKDEFTNRLGMFDTTLLNLNKAANRAVWFQQPPVVFTTKVAAAADAVVELRKFCLKQQTAITGAALDKEREEKEALQVAHKLGRALVTWFHDHGDETNAAKVELSESAWRRNGGGVDIVRVGLRLVGNLAQEIVAGPNATEANTYNINAAAVASVNKEVEEFAAVVSAPQLSIAERAALTNQMRARFNAVELLFVALDDMILQFDTTAAGQALIASHKAARIIRDSGGGSGGPDEPTPPPTPPPPPPAQ